MNDAAPPGGAGAAERSWKLWWTQILAIVSLEARKRFLGRGALPLYFLALLPTVIPAMRLLVSVWTGRVPDSGKDVQVYAGIFQLVILRVSIFFGCVAIFTNLIRGEVLDRSLHYYFLAPVRRSVLLIGKFASGLLAGTALFGCSTVVTWFLVHAIQGPGEAMARLGRPAELAEFATYSGLTALAVLGYGAVFLAAGVFFRTPFLSAMAIWGWEWMNFLLPPLLKKISILYYVHSLLPLRLSDGPFAIMADPAPAALAVPGLAGVALAFLAVSALGLRRMEIRYGLD